MSTQRGTGRFGRIAAVGTVTAMLLAAAAVSGCDSMAKPGGPSGTGVTAAEAALQVPAAVKTQGLAAMKSANITVKNAGYVTMTYTSTAKDGIVVTGVMHGGTGGATDISETDLGLSGGSWKVTGTK
jgi:uncharacterized membrane protein